MYDGKMHRIWKQDILFLEANGHYVEIHTQEKVVRVRVKLDEFENQFTFTGATKGADSVKVDLSAEDEDIENLEAFAEKVSEALA